MEVAKVSLIEQLERELAALESDPTASPDALEFARHMLWMAQEIEERKRAEAWRGRQWEWPEGWDARYG